MFISNIERPKKRSNDVREYLNSNHSETSYRHFWCDAWNGGHPSNSSGMEHFLSLCHNGQWNGMIMLIGDLLKPYLKKTCLFVNHKKN